MSLFVGKSFDNKNGRVGDVYGHNKKVSSNITRTVNSFVTDLRGDFVRTK